jgi:hypothetical protein
VNGLKEDLTGKLIVIKVDVNSPAGREVSARIGSRVTPTFVFFDAVGVELWREFGSLDAQKVRSALP